LFFLISNSLQLSKRQRECGTSLQGRAALAQMV
jgi:hypothetical protein